MSAGITQWEESTNYQKCSKIKFELLKYGGNTRANNSTITSLFLIKAQYCLLLQIVYSQLFFLQLIGWAAANFGLPGFRQLSFMKEHR